MTSTKSKALLNRDAKRALLQFTDVNAAKDDIPNIIFCTHGAEAHRYGAVPSNECDEHK